MAVLPTIKRLVMQDYLTQQSWIGPLLLNLNGFMDSTVNAFNKSLTLAANTTSDVKILTLSSVPTALAPASVNWTKPNRPIAVLVAYRTVVDEGSL